MGVGVNSGNTSVTGSVTSTAVKNTVSCISGYYASSGTSTLGTVGAGKVWRVIGLALTANITGAANAQPVIKCNAVAALTVGIEATAGVVNANSANWSGSYGDAIVLAATQTVTLVNNSAACGCGYSVFYIEESA